MIISIPTGSDLVSKAMRAKLVHPMTNGQISPGPKRGLACKMRKQQIEAMWRSAFFKDFQNDGRKF